MKHKRKLAFSAALLLLISVGWYFGCYPLTIGSPTGASIKFQGQVQGSPLPREQADHLFRLLRQAKPTVFLRDPMGIGCEPALITLHYGDGSEKVFSLWSDYSVLYEGTAEDLTMEAMLGDCLHFGGSLPEEMRELIYPSHHHAQP